MKQILYDIELVCFVARLVKIGKSLIEKLALYNIQISTQIILTYFNQCESVFLAHS